VAVTRDLWHLTPDGDLAPGRGPAGATRLWPYTQGRRTLLRRRDEALVDPLNLIVLGAPPADVAARLVPEGWATPSDGAVHRLWIDGRPRRMRGHLALGTRAERVHVRLWDVPRGTLAAAHHERLDERDRHVVLSWDDARARLAADLETAGFARIAPTGVVTLPALRGVASDGRAWRLVAPGGGS
jgi:hypothetical protein